VVFWIVTRRRVVNNYHTTPCNNPEDHRFHQHRGGSLKSGFLQRILVQSNMSDVSAGDIHFQFRPVYTTKLAGFRFSVRPIGCPETSVRNYHSTLCKIPKERRSQNDVTLQFTLINPYRNVPFPVESWSTVFPPCISVYMYIYTYTCAHARTHTHIHFAFFIC
jgi:hypothetical protein